MVTSAAGFFDRLVRNNRGTWWRNLHSETRTRDGLNSLEASLSAELSDIPDYRGSDRALYFFSQSSRSSIDGRCGHVGIEEKYNPLDLKEHLIDGAIHRGIVWVWGNPQQLSHQIESLSLYLVQTEKGAMSDAAVDLYLPIIHCLAKYGIHLLFVNDQTGDYWTLMNQPASVQLPGWLAKKSEPEEWEIGLDDQGERNKAALDVLSNSTALPTLESTRRRLPELGKSGEFTEIVIGDSVKAAVIEYGNEWRLIELSLLLRSFGYDAVKAVYNPEKHKNVKDRTKRLSPAGHGVERRVADEMRNRFSVILEWGVKI